MLEKLWGLPAHPVYVHFPIVFFTFSSLLVGLYWLDGPGRRINRYLKKLKLGTFDFEGISFLCLFIGFLTAIVAILSGLALVGGWAHAPFPHAPLGIGTTVCYFITLVFRWVFGPAIHTKPLRFFYYFLHLLGLFLVFFTGYQGGELHYS